MSSVHPIKQRPLEREQDWWRVRSLLIETHAICGPRFNWEIRHWDGNRFHRPGSAWQPEQYANHCLWETQSGRLVGAACKEGDDELIIQLHPVARDEIEERMLLWGEEHAAMHHGCGKSQLHICVYEYDQPRIRLLERLGFQKMSYGWITRWMRLVGNHFPQVEVADGYILRATHNEGEEQLMDCTRMADLLNSAFNRPGFHQPEEYFNFMTRSPGFCNELNLVAQAPDGSFAAHAALNYDEANHFGVFEPVCTHPDHRRKRLAKALMFEGLRRIQAYGATHIEVSTGDSDDANALYDSIGFTEYYKAYYWKKEW